MYGGIDKYSGDIAFQKKKEEVDVVEVMNESNCFETIVATNEEGKEVLLGPSLDISSGGLRWDYIEKAEDTFKSVMGMSQMSSMLKDQVRNEVYDCAIRECIDDFIKEKGRKPYVLDIGCGTGLLSLQAARAGAERVYACEMFKGWSEIAVKNVKENGYDAIVTVINKHSSSLIVKEGNRKDYDLERKCDILISEILDTVLLGEGVLVAVRDAKKRLLVKDAVIIPESADVYIELIHSQTLYELSFINIKKECGIAMSTESTKLCHQCRLMPIHSDFLQNKNRVDFVSCSEDHILTHVDLTDGANQRLIHVSIPVSSQPNGLLFSWSVYLYKHHQVYSTNPAHMVANQWQDHWLQAYAPLVGVKKEWNPIEIVCLMGDTNWRLDCCGKEKDIKGIKAKLVTPLSCTCGFHSLLSSGLFGMYNDLKRRRKWYTQLSVVNQYAKEHSTESIVDIGDDSYLSTMLSSLCQQLPSASQYTIYSLEQKTLSLLLWKHIIEFNHSSNAIVNTPPNNPALSDIWNEGSICSILWNCHHYQMEDNTIMKAISYWCMVNSVRKYMSVDCMLKPSFVNIMCMIIELGPLVDSFGRVEEVNGFKHSSFNESIQSWNKSLYPFPLYMYSYRPLSSPQAILSINFSSPLYTIEQPSSISITHEGCCNCIVLWSEYYIGNASEFEDIEENWITPYEENEFCSYEKQLLHFCSLPQIRREGDKMELVASLDETLSFHIHVKDE